MSTTGEDMIGEQGRLIGVLLAELEASRAYIRHPDRPDRLHREWITASVLSAIAVARFRAFTEEPGA